jgi:hypothetical protein
MCKEIYCILNSEYYDILSCRTPYEGLYMEWRLTICLSFLNLDNVLFSFIFIVKWMIANPPIIFGETAELVCAPVKRSIIRHNITSWIGGKDYSILTYNGGTFDPRKYAEIREWHRRKFESILQIYKFDEMEVNVNYSCSIGRCENRKRLSLTPDKFEC